MNISLLLFGAFRQLGVNEITLDLPESTKVSDLRVIFEKYLLSSEIKIADNLIKSSVFATDEFILRDEDFLPIDLKQIAILPPVSGG